jgi:hypothetical protein
MTQLREALSHRIREQQALPAKQIRLVGSTSRNRGLYRRNTQPDCVVFEEKTRRDQPFGPFGQCQKDGKNIWTGFNGLKVGQDMQLRRCRVGTSAPRGFAL